MSAADDLLARMDWLIAARGIESSETGPGYAVAHTRFAVPDDVEPCEGCQCRVVRMPPCGHCEDHYADDGESFTCDADPPDATLCS